MSSKKNVLVDVWLVSLLTDRLVSGLLDELPLGVDEFALYGLLVDLEPMTAADLARGTGLSPTTLSGLLGRCEQRGELRRIPHPADRRSSLLELTVQGRQVYDAALPRLRSALEQLETHLGPSLGRVRGALEELDAGLRHVLDVDARPYSLPETTDDLTSDQRLELDRYAAWIRHRDG